MPLKGFDIKEDAMYRPICRLFDRYYSRGYGEEKVYVKRPYAQMNDIPDFVYFRAYNQIHIVEAKRFVADIYSAAFQLRRYRGNYKYFVLPDGEYYSWIESVDELCDGTFGLILLRLKGRGLCAEFVYDSPRYNRDFSRYYDDYL